VLEHLVNPLGFLQSVAFASNHFKTFPLTYFEVPCIDRVLESGRTVDFYYEHSSQFTSKSFNEMLHQSTLSINEIGYGYKKEVIYSFCTIKDSGFPAQYIDESLTFYENAENSLVEIKHQLQNIFESGKKIAIWGGTGKSAAFMCRYQVDKDRFPVVVDSDKFKVGTYVPGTGQEIKFCDWLVENPVDIIIIPPQWRAKDIITEIESNNILYGQVLIEHNGVLVDFKTEQHPY